MKQRLAVVMAVCGLAVVCAAGAAAAEASPGMAQYPGLVRVQDERIEFEDRPAGTFSRHAIFESNDSLVTVKRWYAAHMVLAREAARQASGGGCIALSRADALLWLERTTVLLCGLPGGTRVVVVERLRW